jgi:hypothetical protein
MGKIALVVQQIGGKLFNVEAAKTLAEFLKADYADYSQDGQDGSEVISVGYLYYITAEQPNYAPENVSLHNYNGYTMVEQAYGPYSSTFRVYNTTGECYEYVMYGMTTV